MSDVQKISNLLQVVKKTSLDSPFSGYFGINYFGMTCIFGVWLISGHSVLASSNADGDYDT